MTTSCNLSSSSTGLSQVLKYKLCSRYCTRFIIVPALFSLTDQPFLSFFPLLSTSPSCSSEGHWYILRQSTEYSVNQVPSQPWPGGQVHHGLVSDPSLPLIASGPVHIPCRRESSSRPSGPKYAAVGPLWVDRIRLGSGCHVFPHVPGRPALPCSRSPIFSVIFLAFIAVIQCFSVLLYFFRALPLPICSRGFCWTRKSRFKTQNIDRLTMHLALSL